MPYAVYWQGMHALGLFLLAALLTILLQPIVPVRRETPRQGAAAFPLGSVLLLVLNIFLFVALMGRVDAPVRWGLIPAARPLPGLVTYAFLHADALHLAGNMVALWLIAPHVEEALGRLRFLIFYVGCGIAAGLAHLGITALQPGVATDSPLVGASGAIFGLMGLFAVRFWRTKVRVLRLVEMPAFLAVIAVFLLQLLLALVRADDRVAYAAHIGGCLFGAGLAFPLRMREDSARAYAIEDAESAAARGDWTLAAAHYRGLLGRRPNDPGLHHALALVCLRLDQSEAATRHFQAALDGFLRAEAMAAVSRVYFDSVQSGLRPPLPPSRLLGVATACETLNQHGLAVDALATVCREHAQAPEAESALLRLARLHLQKLGQPQNAIGLLREFLRTYPQSQWTGHARALLTDAERGETPAPSR